MADDDANDPDPAQVLGLAAEPAAPLHQHHLRDGRQLRVVEAGAHQAIEIRSASGQLEIAVKLTAEGPVLSVEGARIELHAADRVAIQCREFAVQAEEAMTLRSGGKLEAHADDDVVITGEKIYLN